MTPLLPQNFERMRQDKEPDVIGEEGALFHFGSHWLKQWSSAHEQGVSVPDRHAENSSLSPYWHKMQFYENKLINGLFPDNTIHISAGYDNRITKDGDEHRFTMKGEKPATISEDATGDGERAEKYRSIVYPLYRDTKHTLDAIRTGRDFNDRFADRYDKAFDEAEDKLLENLDAEEFRLFHGYHPELAHGVEGLISHLEKEVKKINPDSDVLELLKAGIVPMHPSLNFVPDEDQSGGRGPRGTYLELTIMSVGRFMDYAGKQN
ncbi:MAG: hypothetical protein Q8P90_04150, partial [bacterium]|nr:hypothetical protein [bacterium]